MANPNPTIKYKQVRFLKKYPPLLYVYTNVNLPQESNKIFHHFD